MFQFAIYCRRSGAFVFVFVPGFPTARLVRHTRIICHFEAVREQTLKSRFEQAESHGETPDRRAHFGSTTEVSQGRLADLSAPRAERGNTGGIPRCLNVWALVPRLNGARSPQRGNPTLVVLPRSARHFTATDKLPSKLLWETT